MSIVERRHREEEEKERKRQLELKVIADEVGNTFLNPKS
jgi:hypothetical protein